MSKVPVKRGVRMFGLGVWEIGLILVVALLVLGPDKLPDAAKSLGKALNDFRRAGDDIKREVMGDTVYTSPPAPSAHPGSIPAPENTVANKADPRAGATSADATTTASPDAAASAPKETT